MHPIKLLLLTLASTLTLEATLLEKSSSLQLGIAQSITKWDRNTNDKIEEKENKAIKRTKAWLDRLYVNLDLIAKYGYGDKKRLSELLGAYWMLHRYSDQTTKESIQKRVTPFYEYTKKQNYLDLATLDAKQFKKNSMSYLRIMWLLKEMNYDITHLTLYFNQHLKKRMDAHLVRRGPWQKSMFARYYDFFGFEKPTIIKDTSNQKGLIGIRKRVETYKFLDAYALTHQVYVAYDYGANRNQTRFNQEDMKYIQDTLLNLAEYYRKRKSWDIHAEIVQCLIYVGLKKHKLFTKNYHALLNAQNYNGSWGKYDHLKKKFGNFVDTKYYLHTTGVALSAIVEHARGKWD
jgi:hypothetical protein